MKFEKMFRLKDTELKSALHNELKGKGYKPINNQQFLYAEGNAPYMLVAHLDTVHKESPDIICYSKNGDYMMSPQGIGGDDRCGVYIILKLLEKLPYKPHIVFTMAEEVGGIGAQAFVNCIKPMELKYIVEYDRKGNKDCVFYQCDNKEFVEFVEGFGFKKEWGSFSDISTIAPAFGVAAVNISSGYYNPHTEHEYVSIKDMETIIDKSVKMLTTECKAFEYVEKTYGYDNDYWDYHSYRADVMFLPAGTVYTWDYKGNTYVNDEKEIAIDEWGRYYRYNKEYGDFSPTTRVYPIDEEPKYDEMLSEKVDVFSWE